MAYVKRNAGGGYEPHGRLVRRDPPVWAAAEWARLDPDAPVPLVAYRAPSLSRSLGVQTLEESGRGSRITCIVQGVNGVLAAVRAGLGVGIFARSPMPGDLVEPPASAGLPPLPEIDLVLMATPRAAAEPAEALTAAISAVPPCSTAALGQRAEVRKPAVSSYRWKARPARCGRSSVWSPPTGSHGSGTVERIPGATAHRRTSRSRRGCARPAAR